MVPITRKAAASILRNSASLFGQQVFTTLARGAMTVLLARMLGEAAYGSYAYALNVSVMLIGLATLGTDPLLVRELARLPARPGQVLLAGGLLLRAATACVAGLGLAAWALWSGVGWLPAVFALALVGRAGTQFCAAVLLSRERADRAALLEVSRQSLEIAGVLALALLGAPLWMLAAAVAASTWLVFLRGARRLRLPLCAVLVRLRRPGPRLAARVRSLAAEGVPLALHAVLIAWLLQSPLLLTHGHLPGAEFGRLALAVQSVVLLRMLPGVLAQAALPLLSRSALRGDGKDMVFLLVLMHLVGLFGGLAVLLAPGLAEPVALALFGPAYAGIGPLIAAATWMLLPIALIAQVAQHALIHGRIRLQVLLLLAVAVGVLTLGGPVAGSGDAAAMVLVSARGLGVALLLCCLALLRGPGMTLLMVPALLTGFGLLMAAEALGGIAGPLVFAAGIGAQAWLVLRAVSRRRDGAG